MIIHGQLLLDPASAPTLGWLRVEDGRVTELAEGEPPRDAEDRVLGGAARLIVPAFIDAHTHLPQTDSIGCDGMELLEWLEAVIFPAEIWWGRGHAATLAGRAVARMVRQGTGGFAGYLTSHGEINRGVLDMLQTRSPLRFIAGRSAMDRHAPDELVAEDLQRHRISPPPSPMLPLPHPATDDRHRASANPRFAISCTDELLAEIGWLAGDRPEMFVQTHLAETLPEIEFVRRLFPDAPHYTGVYDRFGLLGPRTLLAHCLHLSDAEWSLIREREAVVVHCPSANVFLEAGIFDLAAAHEHGVRLALGTDVAAGSDIAMPRVARSMIDVAKMRRLAQPDRPCRVPTPVEAWRLITDLGADALGWPDAGRIAVGAAADLLILRPPETWMDEHLIGRLLHAWSADLIESRVLAGREIDPATIAPGC